MLPFIDLKQQFKAQEQRIRSRVNTVLEHGKYIMGPEVAELEAALAEYTGSPHCVTCSSGTDALLMLLMALGVGPGDAVFTSPFTFIATTEVVSLLGATPVFVDIKEDTFNLDPSALERAINAVTNQTSETHPLPSCGLLRPKAIIAVDLFGLPADYSAILAVADKHGLSVISDGAQSFGAEIDGKKACSVAPHATTSFFPAKPLGCYGDGGAIFTNDADIATVLRSIRVHGQGVMKYENVRIGLNARLDTLQASILLAKLEFFPDEILQRQKVATSYSQALVGFITPPVIPAGLVSAWAQYSLLHDKRDIIMSGLRERGIPTMIYYPTPLHLQPAYSGLGYAEGDMPVSESASRRIFSLPMHPYLTESQISKITDAIKDILANHV